MKINHNNYFLFFLIIGFAIQTECVDNKTSASDQKQPTLKTLADLKKEAEINIYAGKCFLGHTKFVGAPSTLLRALQSLNNEQTIAIDEYHKAIVQNEPLKTRAPLKRNVELLLRNEEDRTEILDNLRWLQRDGSISAVQKFTPYYSKFLPFIASLLPLAGFPFVSSFQGWITGAACLPMFAFSAIALNDKTTTHRIREKYKGKEKFTNHKGII